MEVEVWVEMWFTGTVQKLYKESSYCRIDNLGHNSNKSTTLRTQNQSITTTIINNLAFLFQFLF